MHDVFVYLAGPITPRDGYTLEDNRALGEQVLYECLRLGIPCFLPPIIPHSEVHYDICCEYDNAVLARCTAILMLPRWQSSPGALKERALAITLGLPIYESLEELREKYGKTGRTDSKGDGKRAKSHVRSSSNKTLDNERPQQSNSEGAHETTLGEHLGKN